MSLSDIGSRHGFLLPLCWSFSSVGICSKQEADLGLYEPGADMPVGQLLFLLSRQRGARQVHPSLQEQILPKTFMLRDIDFILFIWSIFIFFLSLSLSFSLPKVLTVSFILFISSLELSQGGQSHISEVLSETP